MLAIHLLTGLKGLDAAIEQLAKTVKGCSIYGTVTTGEPVNVTGIWGNLRFYSVDLLSDEDCQNLLDELREKRTDRKYSRAIVIADHAGAGSTSLQWQHQFVNAGVYEILEFPLNLHRLQYLIESYKIDLKSYGPPAELQAAAVVPMKETESTSMVRVQQKTQKVASLNINVLLTGETGVGKTHWAQQIHQLSNRSDEPFVVVNCANLTPTLAESQLFGHAKGSFTGADQQHQGHFELVGQGTLFLDELDSLPTEVQGKLLRVVEEREFRPVGDRKVRPFQGRLISATNCQLDDLVANRSFRSDLFFRMNAYEISIPPLRERIEELPRFVQLFADQFCQNNPIEGPKFTASLVNLLARYNWPGNLRELKNAVEYALIDCDTDTLDTGHFPDAIRHFLQTLPETQRTNFDASEPDEGDKKRAESGSITWNPDCSEESAIRHLVGALARNDNNRTKAARELGVSRMTIYNLLKRHGFQ